jgi:hypothetical protein
MSISGRDRRSDISQGLEHRIGKSGLRDGSPQWLPTLPVLGCGTAAAAGYGGPLPAKSPAIQDRKRAVTHLAKRAVHVADR